MTQEINQKIQELREIFSREVSKNVTSITVFINSQGAKIEINQRTPKQLKQEGISMRNVAGEWIKEQDA